MKRRIGTLLLAAALCGCGKSPQTSSSSAPSPWPALATTLPKGSPPPPTAGIPADHMFDVDGFSARDLNHGEGAWKLTVNRQWNGANAGASHFGPGWSDANAIRLSMIDRDHLLIWRGEVGWRKAHRTGDKVFSTDEGENIQQSDKGWVAQLAGGAALTFDPQGRLVTFQAATGPAISYTYTKIGRLAAVGTSPANTLKYSYDSSGKRVTRIDGPEGLRLDYEYDDKGRLGVVTNSRRIRIQYRYGNDGVLSAAEDQFGNRFDLSQPIEVTMTAPERGVTTAGPRREVAGKENTMLKYDDFGRIATRTGIDGHNTRFEYNNLDLPTLIAVSAEPVERRQYDEHGMLTRRERGSSLEEFAYDSSGRLAAKRGAGAGEQHYEYDSDDRITRVKTTGGGEVAYEYAPDGKLIDEVRSTGERRHWNYNAAGQLIDFTDENGLKTSYGYDNQGRPSYAEDRIHGRKQFSYPGENEIAIDTPDLGRSTTRTNIWGRPLFEGRPGNRSTSFRYGKDGALASVIGSSGMMWRYEAGTTKSPLGLTSAIERDQAGRVSKVTRGEVTRREYRYDNDGRLQQEFSPAGAAASFKYGSDGRIAEALLPEGKVTYSTDKNGLHIKGPGYEVEESYYPDGSLARRNYQSAKMELRLPRDEQGRVAGIELNDLKATYSYNARGQIEQIKLPNGAIRVGRDEAGRVTGLTLAKAASLEIKYDRADRMTRLEAKQPSGKSIFVERYSYDAAGNVAECATDSAPPQKFEYDLEDRLTKINDGKTTRSLQYDVDGNIAGTQSGTQLLRRGLDPQGRPTEQGTNSYLWNASGNLESVMTAKGKTESNFDAADRLVRRTVGENSWTFGYLPNGDRLWKERAGKRCWYVYLPDRLVGLKDEAGVDWLLVSLPGSDWPIALVGSNGKTFFVVADLVGSARRLVDETGAIVASADYSPFGIPRASSGTPPLGLFAGMIADESGLCYARQRYYDPELGQFVSLDPEVGTPGRPATHNAYAYAGNNPLRYRDPLGTDFASEVAAPDSNIFNCLTPSQQAAVKEAWDGARRANRVLTSPMKSTPAEIAAASRHLQECNAALEQMNAIGRARYKYVLLASGPTEELSAVGKANAARNTAEAKAALEAMGEMPRVGRVNLGINAENLGSTLQNVPVTPEGAAIPAGRALVPRGPTALTEAGTATRGAGAGGSGASTAWDENLFTGESPLNKMGRPKGEIPMKYDPANGVWRPAVPSGSGSSFAATEEGARWLGPKLLNAGGKAVNALGPVLQVLNALEAARLGGTMAKNYIDNLNQPFVKNQAAAQAAREMGNDLAQRLAELAASDPNAIILGDGRKFDPNNPDDLAEILQGLSQNLYFGRKPFDNIFKYIPKLDPNVLPKTYMGAAPGDTAIDLSLENARKLLQTAYASEKTAREAAAELAKDEAEAQAQLQSAMTTAGARAVVESDVATAPEKIADLKTQTSAVRSQVKTMQSAETEMRAAIAKGDEAATKICDYAGRVASASEDEISAWRKDATSQLNSASNLLNTAQAKIDAADVSIDGLQSAISIVDGLKGKLMLYETGSNLAEKADLSPDAALASARTASLNAETARTSLNNSLGQMRDSAGQAIKLVSPYVALNPEAVVINSAASSLGRGIEEPGVFNFNSLLSAAMPVVDAAIANQKAVEKAIGNSDPEAALTAAREVLSEAQSLRASAKTVASGTERYAALQTASQCFTLIKAIPKVAEATPSPTPEADEVMVPDLALLDSLTKMKLAATSAGLKPELVATTEMPPTGSKGYFVRQFPSANKMAKKGSALQIFIAQKLAAPSPTPEPTAVVKTSTPIPSPSPAPEDEMVVVPPVKGAESIDYARTILNQAGFKSAFKAIKPKKKEDELTVADSAPAAGEKAKRGSTVVVFIYQKFDGETASTSPTPTAPPLGPTTSGTMPKLTGLTLEQASARLTSKMRIGSDEVGNKPPKPEEAMTIYAQTPAAGTKIDPQKEVVVTVKRYGSAKTGGETSSTAGGSNGDALAPSWKGVFASWTGPATNDRGTSIGDYTLTARKRQDGSIDYMLGGDFLDEPRTEGGKFTAKTAADVWVGGQPEILREVHRITVEPSGGKLILTMVEHTVMRAGGETKKTILRAELSPDATPKTNWMGMMDDNAVTAALVKARADNLEHEAQNARSKK